MRVYQKFFILSLSSIAFFFSPSYSKGIEEAHFLKAGIKPIKNEQKAPNFVLEDLYGRRIEFIKYVRGKVVLLNFWATWCGTCKEEMDSMESLYQQLKDKDFVLLAISVDYEGREKVKEFIEKKGFTFPVLLDLKLRTLHLYEVKGIPTAVLIDKQMIIIGKAVGPRDWKSQEIFSLLNLLIKQ